MRKAVLLLLINTVCLIGFAQQTEVRVSDIKYYNEGLDLYEKEKYSAAIKSFEKAQEEVEDPTSEVYSNSAYYKALSSLNLFNRNAAYLLKKFVQDYPESPRVKNAYFQLGKYYYRKKDWEDVLYWYDKLDFLDLTNKESHEFYFRKGYALYQLDSLTKSKQNFYEIIDVPNLYYAPANYYYGQIAYEQGKYQTAITRFKKIEKDEKFERIVPYYITQLYYLQEEYDSLISYGKPFLENPKTKRQDEISKLIGEAYFAQEDYNNAIPYLEEYIKISRAAERQDYFQLGFAYHKTTDCENSIKYLQRVTYEKDSLAQQANYLLAECQLKQGNKKAARSSFYDASQMKYNEEVAEDALFSFAQLSYELDYDPYSKAIDAFIQYLEKYPDAIRKEEAYNYLVNIYLNSKNYRSAIASLENTKDLDPRLEKVYQKLLYNLATEEFQNGQYNEASETFEKITETKGDKEISTKSHYWKAEALYRLNRYNSSIESYKAFLFEPRAILLDEFKPAHYNIGYAYFQQEKYTEAANWFRKYINKKEIDSLKLNDAYIRTGDAYFVTKQYLLSLEYYQKALNLKLRDTDYVLYQYAQANGVLKNPDEKIRLLTKLVDEYPNSDYFAAASYELGRSYLNNQNTDKALQTFENIVENYPYSPYKKRAQVSIGLIYYNQSQNEKALSIFKKVVDENPSYSDSKEAMRAIKNIYKETGRVQEYEDYITGLDFMNVSDGALDSLNYESAELQYMASNCGQAVEDFKAYLEKFDQPIFEKNANFYIAECLYKKNNLPESMEYYQLVADEPINKFSEPAISKAAYLNYQNENYIKAHRYYEKLQRIAQYEENKQQAIIGLMRTSFELEKYSDAIQYARQVKDMQKIKEPLFVESLFTIAKSLEASGQKDKAMEYYTSVTDTTQNQKAAESKYRIASLLYEQNKADSSQLDTAKKAVFKLINHTPTYDYWLAKGLILLADIYLAQDDSFQAKATLESVLENYDGDEAVLTEAQNKLDKIIEAENPQPEEQEETEIDLSIDSVNYEKLMPEEEMKTEEWENE
ncbi:MAG: tetratricopeptide repeat protein [Salibacter sp.]|uniref:tetratricopeptide repeat protein n=1 Tax=Salibacter sp. TaxID=2010995 RepID=UPI0028708B83|nr:tetratricopeptide repeat protein [Salibacter sp.]MDR9397980.1 tetratricopeptide repeat protein [Salibacter sp.]